MSTHEMWLLIFLGAVTYVAGAIPTYVYTYRQEVESAIDHLTRLSFMDPKIDLGWIRFISFCVALTWFVAFPVKWTVKAISDHNDQVHTRYTNIIVEKRAANRSEDDEY